MQNQLIKILLAAVSVIGGLSSLRADEGMWIVNELNARCQARMSELGFMRGYDFIYDADKPSLSNAVVVFGRGCTGVTVSDEGLVFTNHHCGFSAIQKLSSVEHDYLKNGFVSRDAADELPVDGLTVRYLRQIVDVTDSIVPQIEGLDDELRRIAVADSIAEQLKKTTGAGMFVEVEIEPFYNRNKYYLVIYDVYRDVRLVFAPPTTLGKFGGDTDNWMWPRHTCDFSVFRVYADADNRPAEYSVDNRPYNPAFVAEISLQGYKENDYAMTIGFPGTTDRYLSSWGIEQMVNSINKPRIEVRGVKQDIWRKAMNASDAVRIKYASKYANSSNYWKNAIGMNRGVTRLRLVERKRREEAAFGQWAAAEANKSVYGETLRLLEEGYTSTGEQRLYLTYLTEAFISGAEIIKLARMFAQIDNSNLSTVDVEDILNDRIRPFFKNYEPAVDRQTLAAMLRLVKERVPAAFLPDIYGEIDKKYKGNYERYVADLFARAELLSEDRIAELLKDPNKYKRYIRKDPLARLADDVTMTLKEIVHAVGVAEYNIFKGERLYVAGLQQMYPDSAFYPDANSTMRVSYGSMRGYRPYDAAWYDYYTTSQGILEKEDSTSYEFGLQPEIVDLVRRRDFASYANENGELQLCFVSDNDITGGNSGSPVFDRNGRVIGLAFDGNWEAMSGDIVFEPALQRTISVDIRYVLWMIDKWGACPRIINELKIVR